MSTPTPSPTPDEETFPLEPYIPLRVADLVEILIHEAGTPDFDPPPVDQQQLFRTFATALGDRVHTGFRNMLTHLKTSYAPFDPDSDTHRLGETSETEQLAALEQLFNTFVTLLERAGYHHMTRAEIEETMQGASHWGIEMEVCWDVFDKVDVFYRGAGTGYRMKRVWWNPFKQVEVEVPTFRRVVVILKQTAHHRLGHNPDTDNVFMKLFKDIPQMDIEMLLPGTRVRMPKFDRGKLGASIGSSFLYLVYKLATTVSIGGLLSGSLMAIYTPLALLLGYGYKTVYSFQVSRRTYMLQLAQSLYYQSLDTNSGVMHRLFDDAAEQEVRQALLVYYFLWRFAGPVGWTVDELQTVIVADLYKRIGEQVKLCPGDALARLTRLGIVKCVGDRYLALLIADALPLVKQPLTPQPSQDRPSTWRGYVRSSVPRIRSKLGN